MDLGQNPTPLLYSLLAIITLGFGIGMLVWQTGATQHALVTRRSMIAGGVLLILFGGAVLLTQILAMVFDSYASMPK